MITNEERREVAGKLLDTTTKLRAPSFSREWDAMLDEVFEAMDSYFLDSYPKVVRFTKEHHPEWKPVVYRKFSRAIAEYAKGLHYEGKQG